jgi:hypothetical protein
VQLEQSVARYLSQLDSADRQEPSEALAAKTTRLKVPVAIVHRLELAAVDRNACLCKQTHLPAELDKARAHLADRSAIARLDARDLALKLERRSPSLGNWPRARRPIIGDRIRRADPPTYPRRITVMISRRATRPTPPSPNPERDRLVDELGEQIATADGRPRGKRNRIKRVSVMSINDAPLVSRICQLTE